MALPLYLAMTAGELSGNAELPDRVAWMACHFSSYGTGLSNCPSRLPEGSMLILNDRIPPQGHDPQAVAQALQAAAKASGTVAVLLDFQRPGSENAAATVQEILRTLPCPVGVSLPYAQGSDCPVFLPPPPLTQPLKEYLSPWQGREIWLEAACDAVEITVTEKGSQSTPCSLPEPPERCHTEENLHCRYFMDVCDSYAKFTLFRTEQQLARLLSQAQALGVSCAIGLYQELGNFRAEI